MRTSIDPSRLERGEVGRTSQINQGCELGGPLQRAALHFVLYLHRDMRL